jgi:1,4-dihydroxy-2-naphthoate octaprenyltransferase
MSEAVQPKIKTILTISLVCIITIAVSLGLKGVNDFWSVVLFIVGCLSIASAWIYYFFYDVLAH